MKEKIVKFYIIPLIAILAVLAYLKFGTSQTNNTPDLANADPDRIHVITNFGVPIGGDFTLTDQNGKKQSFYDLNGKPTLLYFGFTHCPDYCPTALQSFDAVAKLVGSDKINRVFVSVDPERDTVDALKNYLSLFTDGLIGLTGTLEETDAVAKKWRIFYSLNKQNEDDTDYMVDHITYFYLTNPDGELTAMIKPDARPADIAAFLTKNGFIE